MSGLIPAGSYTVPLMLVALWFGQFSALVPGEEVLPSLAKTVVASSRPSPASSPPCGPAVGTGRPAVASGGPPPSAVVPVNVPPHPAITARATIAAPTPAHPRSRIAHLSIVTTPSLAAQMKDS